MLSSSAGNSSARDADEYFGFLQEQNEDEHNEGSMAYSVAPTMPHGAASAATMTPKIAPHYDGRTSWFAYEELVYDWEDSCVLDVEKRGSALKNRL